MAFASNWNSSTTGFESFGNVVPRNIKEAFHRHPFGWRAIYSIDTWKAGARQDGLQSILILPSIIDRMTYVARKTIIGRNMKS